MPKGIYERDNLERTNYFKNIDESILKNPSYLTYLMLIAFGYNSYGKINELYKKMEIKKTITRFSKMKHFLIEEHIIDEEKPGKDLSSRGRKRRGYVITEQISKYIHLTLKEKEISLDTKVSKEMNESFDLFLAQMIKISLQNI
jgi:coproporphyrinogen III oxidase-like Fe-S oxidoreductase